MPGDPVNAVTIFGDPFERPSIEWGEEIVGRMARRLARLTARRVSVLISFYTSARAGNLSTYTDEIVQQIIANDIVSHQDQIVEIHSRCLPVNGKTASERTVIALVPHWTATRKVRWDNGRRESVDDAFDA